jgi:hypothetical protein
MKAIKTSSDISLISVQERYEASTSLFEEMGDGSVALFRSNY